jgi:hypothetical protein
VYDSGCVYAQCQLDSRGQTCEPPIAGILDGRPDDADGNAKLIAAAPEMFSILRGVLDSIEAYIAIHKPEEEWDEYDYMMLPRWKAAHALMEKLDGKRE